MTSTAPISKQIWDMKYRFKGSDGAPLDKTVEDTWHRVAGALAQAEAPEARADWEARFFEALEDFKFLPAGRIIAGAGTERDVTLFNCFVMGSVPDDMGGIFEHLREAALTMQKGGGIGYDFSTLRPKGAPVKGVGADASGPLSFMDVWDAMCRTIMSAGHRRGAMMATLRCDHPDIADFIKAKQDAGRLRMFNMSVLVTDDFVQAVKDDDPWDLTFDGMSYGTVPARELWDSIMRATYAYAEPGVIFIDRINAQNNLDYCETISATNPCVTRDTWVLTVDGPRQVGDLVARAFGAVIDGKIWESGEDGFFRTGHKPVVRLATREGYQLRLTADHPVRIVTTSTRYRQEKTWRNAGDLRPGDEVVLHDHRSLASWPGDYDDDEGYLIGLLIGDGTLKADKAVLSVWPGAAVAGGSYEQPGVLAVMDRALEAARQLPHRADFTGWIPVAGRGEMRLSLGAVKTMAGELGLAPGAKTITPAIEQASSAFYAGFLRGFFDADGSIQGNQKKGVSVRLAQSDLDRLQAIQRMLLRLGIASRIYSDRRPAGPRLLPDGKGGRRLYECRADHELVVSGENLALFSERVGFVDSEKAARLRTALGSYRRSLNRARFTAIVECVKADGEEDVFDVRIPGINAFDAGGLYVHNCGEQPLPPYGACLLGSINLAKLVDDPFGEAAAIDMEALDRLVRTAVRMMDNVVDISRFPLEAQAHEARAKRRIGLGVTGLADALIMCRARYGSERGGELIETWMAQVERSAYLASAELAKEKGAFPLYDKTSYLAGETVSRLDQDVRAAIAENGIRNALLTSIAPTGTISLFADNVSSGVEPVFSYTFNRKVLMPDGTHREEVVSDYAYRHFLRQFGEDTQLPDYFVTAMDLKPEDHVRVQAAAQKYVDSSISKTINCPEDIGFEAFKDIYMLAYESGCKGCTTYRPNDVTGAVLEAAPKESDEPELPLDRPVQKPEDEYEAGGVVYMTRPLDRPGTLPGKTYKVRWPDSDHAIYITLNDIIQDSRRRPFEIFINSKNMEHYAWTVALTRMISAVFRRGGDVSFVVEELKAVFDPRGGQWMNGRYVPSLLAAIGEVIESHLMEIGFIADERITGDVNENKAVVNAPETGPGMSSCPKCSAPSLVRQEGCDTCLSCGYSKCS